MSLGDLMMFLVYLAMLLEPMAVLANSVSQVQNNLAGFDRVLDLLAEPREMADHPASIYGQEAIGRRPDQPRGRLVPLPDGKGSAVATSTWTSSPAKRSPWSAAAARGRRRSAT